MKRAISCILVLILVLQTLLLAGCRNDENTGTETILNENYTSALGVLQHSTDLSSIQTYLIKWANTNNIKVSHDKYNNVIMSIKATPGYEDIDSTILHCTLSLGTPEHTASAISVMQYIMKHAEEHGFVRLIFTGNTDNAQEGINKIKVPYLDGKNLISLDDFDDNSLTVASAGSELYTMTRNIKRQKPSYTMAYEISIRDLVGAPLSDEETHPNPITVIGDLLASAKSSGILMEIASFTGGTDPSRYPAAASAVILINQNDVNKLTRLVEKNQEKLYSKYTEQEPNVVYDFTETTKPDSVLSFNDSSNLISFLYACINGTYLKNDAGEVIARSNIGGITTDDKMLTISIDARSKSSTILEEMDTLFATVCGLCDITYSTTQVYPIWEKNAEFSYDESSDIREDVALSANPLVTDFSAVMKEYSGKEPKYKRSLDYTACSVAAERNPSLNAVSFGITQETLIDQAQILLNYLEQK